jgi:hypothetical protein
MLLLAAGILVSVFTLLSLVLYKKEHMPTKQAIVAIAAVFILIVTGFSLPTKTQDVIRNDRQEEISTVDTTNGINANLQQGTQH